MAGSPPGASLASEVPAKARLVAQRALEGQFIEILKQAKSVKDALEVNVHLADVRTTIERLEGRQHFLENQTSMSTIKLAIMPTARVAHVDRFAFGESARRSAEDFLNVSGAIVDGGIRLFGVVTPILALVILPCALLARALIRRRRRVFAAA